MPLDNDSIRDDTNGYGNSFGEYRDVLCKYIHVEKWCVSASKSNDISQRCAIGAQMFEGCDNTVEEQLV